MQNTQRYIDFISEVKDTVYRLALSIVGSVAEAEDITQDIYERVWRARDTVLESQYPRAYVCRMTRNLAIDRMRNDRRTQGEDGLRRVEALDGDHNTSLNDITELTHRIIATLPERQRTTIHMRDVEGYEIEEIAEALASDEVSVRMNLSRARKSVREQILKAMNYGVK